MSLMRELSEKLGRSGRLYIIVALILIVVIALAYFVFYRFTIAPQLASREELILQVEAVRNQAIKAELAAAASGPEIFRQKIEAAQAEMREAASAFLTQAQAAQVLSSLSYHMDETGVAILKLENVPPPALKEGETKSTAYDAQIFQLDVAGTLSRLMDFVTRIEEARQKSVRISNVSIPKSDTEPHLLTMRITIYTSPHAIEPSE